MNFQLIMRVGGQYQMIIKIVQYRYYLIEQILICIKINRFVRSKNNEKRRYHNYR